MKLTFSNVAGNVLASVDVETPKTQTLGDVLKDLPFDVIGEERIYAEYVLPNGSIASEADKTKPLDTLFALTAGYT